MPSDDRYRDGKRQNAGDGARGANQSTPRTYRHFVSVADRCHGDDGPPEAVRDALNLRAGLTEFGVVDGARVDQQADDESNEKETQSFETGFERQNEHLKPDRVLREFENADQSYDAQKGQ